MSDVLTIAGVLLILLALRDMRHELFHPERAGSLSRLVARAVWHLSRSLAKYHRPVLYRAGPLVLIAVGATWVILDHLGVRAAPDRILEALARDHLRDIPDPR